MRRSTVFYFDLKSMKLAWIEQIRPLSMIFAIKPSERRFSDEDFKHVLTECPKRSKNDYVSALGEAFDLF